MPATLKTY